MSFLSIALQKDKARPVSPVPLPSVSSISSLTSPPSPHTSSSVGLVTNNSTLPPLNSSKTYSLPSIHPSSPPSSLTSSEPSAFDQPVLNSSTQSTFTNSSSMNHSSSLSTYYPSNPTMPDITSFPPTSYGRVNSSSLRFLLAAVSSVDTQKQPQQQQPIKQMLLPPIAPAPVSTSSSSSSSSSSPIVPERSYTSSNRLSSTNQHRRYSSTSANPSSSLSGPSLTPKSGHRTSLSTSLLASVSATSPQKTGPSSTNYNGPLNTNSPLALAAAAAVTPEKLANLLLTEGPLPIRHITAHLALNIPGFGDLSLSKQRRLIIAALDSIDSVNQVRFEKIGWGRWAARPLDSSVAHLNAAGSSQAAGMVVTTTKISSTSARKRRESMPAQTGNISRPPLSPLLRPSDGSNAGSVSILASSSSGLHAASVWADDAEDSSIAAGNSSSTLSALNSSASSSTIKPFRTGQSSVQHPQTFLHPSFSRSHSHSGTSVVPHPSMLTRNRHRRRSSIRRARMRFRENEDDEDDEEEEDDIEEAIDDETYDLEDDPESRSRNDFGLMKISKNNDNAIISDNEDDQNLDADGDEAIETDSSEYDAVAGDLELDDEDAERRRLQRKERRQRAHRRASVTSASLNNNNESGIISRSGSNIGLPTLSSASVSSNGSFVVPSGPMHGSSSSLSGLNNNIHRNSNSFNSQSRTSSIGSSSMNATRKLFQARNGMHFRRQSETDEEDWETMGAASLRRSSNVSGSGAPTTTNNEQLPGANSSWNELTSNNYMENVNSGNGPMSTSAWQANLSSLRSAPLGTTRPQERNNNNTTGHIQSPNFREVEKEGSTISQLSLNKSSTYQYQPQKLPGIADIMAMSAHTLPPSRQQQQQSQEFDGKEEEAIAALVQLRSVS